MQRTLFRMQLDPGFAARLRDRDRDAIASTALGESELGWLIGADPSAVSADREGRRRQQFLRNLVAEFELSAACGDGAWIDGFPASENFHDALRGNASLPLAFADYAVRIASERRDPLFAELVSLESALVRARRVPRERVEAAVDEIVLAPWASLLETAPGTLELAARIRAALDRGQPPPRDLSLRSGQREILLISAPPDKSAFREPEVQIEKLNDAVSSFLASARAPLDAHARANFAHDCDAEPEDIEALVEGLVADRVLLRGR